MPPKTPKKTKPRAVKQSKANIVAPTETTPAEAPVPAPKSNRFRLLLWVLVGGFLLYNYLPSCKGRHSAAVATPGAPAAAVAPAEPTAAWGPKLDYKVVDKFSIRDGLMDLAIDVAGTVYALAGSEISVYVGGKQKKVSTLDAGPNRSLATDGKSLYLTHSDNNSVLILGTDLTVKGDFKVKDAQRLLGIAVLPNQGLVASEVCGNALFFLDNKGRLVSKRKGPVGDPPAGSFVYDLEALPNGDVLGNDIYQGLIFSLAAGTKTYTTFPTPCGTRLNHRLPVLHGKAYIGCTAENVVRVLSTAGKAMGYFKFDDPELLVAGEDGFLYIQSSGKLYKVKPL